MSGLHITVQLRGVTPTLEKCISCCTSIHCPFCSPQIFKPTVLSKIRRHLEGHKKRAVQHKDYTIFKCNLDCKGIAHFHCPCCQRLFDRRDRLLQHLAHSNDQAAGKEWAATTRQWDGDEGVRDIKSEHEDTTDQEDAQSDQDTGSNQDEWYERQFENIQDACLSERSGTATCAEAPLRFTAVPGFVPQPAGHGAASSKVQLKLPPAATGLLCLPGGTRLGRPHGESQQVKRLSAAEAEQACQLVACSASQAAASHEPVDHESAEGQPWSDCTSPLGNRKRAHSCDETTESAMDEDELFLKSLLPDLRSLPKPKKAFVKFKIHQLIYEAGHL